MRLSLNKGAVQRGRGKSSGLFPASLAAAQHSVINKSARFCLVSAALIAPSTSARSRVYFLGDMRLGALFLSGRLLFQRLLQRALCSASRASNFELCQAICQLHNPVYSYIQQEYIAIVADDNNGTNTLSSNIDFSASSFAIHFIINRAQKTQFSVELSFSSVVK